MIKSSLTKFVSTLVLLILVSPAALAVTVVAGDSYNKAPKLIETASIQAWNAGSVLAPPAVVEGEIIYEGVEFVNGIETNVVNLSGLSEGMYQLTMTDFVFPNTFDALGATIVSATESVAAMMFSEGDTQNKMVFEIEKVDSYYLAIYGAASGAYNLGLYGVELRNVSLSSVPLPMPALLVLIGLGVVASVKRRLK